MQKVLCAALFLLLLTFTGCAADPNKPTAQEIKIQQAYHAALQQKSNPKWEQPPANMAKDDFTKWAAENTKKVADFEKKVSEDTAKQFGVTAQQATDTYLKVVMWELSKK